VNEDSFIFTSLPTFVVCGVFNDSYSNRSEMVVICISFMARDGEHFFMCFVLPFGFLPLKNFCLVQLYTSFLAHQFWGTLVL
jgi:hypothetical protein